MAIKDHVTDHGTMKGVGQTDTIDTNVTINITTGSNTQMAIVTTRSGAGSGTRMGLVKILILKTIL